MLDYQLRSGVEIERVPYGEKGRKGENLISSWHAMYGHPHSTVRRIKDKGHGPRTLDHPDTPPFPRWVGPNECAESSSFSVPPLCN